MRDRGKDASDITISLFVCRSMVRIIKLAGILTPATIDVRSMKNASNER